MLRWGKEPQAWPAAVVTRRGQLCVRLGHTWSLLYLRAQGPMPCRTRAAKEHLPDSTASVAASSMEGNQSARAVSCRAGGYGGGFLGGTDRSAHSHRAERGPCGPTEAGMERGEREKIGKAEAKGTRRTHTHIDARGVEGAVVGGYGCAGIGRQCGAAAARHQAHPTAVDGEPDGQRQPHTARCGQQAVQQGHAQQGPVLPA